MSSEMSAKRWTTNHSEVFDYDELEELIYCLMKEYGYDYNKANKVANKILSKGVKNNDYYL